MYSQREVEGEVEHPQQIAVYGLQAVEAGKEAKPFMVSHRFPSRLLWLLQARFHFHVERVEQVECMASIRVMEGMEGILYLIP
jgi:hypothetical protein